MKRISGILGFALALLAVAPPARAQAAFPYEQEMFLDVKPLPGSKRVPMLEILADGRAMIDLWCKSGEGRVEVMGEAIKITLGPMREENCPPERTQLGGTLASNLESAIKWRIEDYALVIYGPNEELRYLV